MDDRRDEMRYALRAKLSQKDYLDKEMKAFHYGKKGVELPNRSALSMYQPPEGSGVPGGDIATQIAAAEHMLYLK